MTSADLIPVDEAERIAAIKRYRILDTPEDGTFDRIAALAARFFDVPIAIVRRSGASRVYARRRSCRTNRGSSRMHVMTRERSRTRSSPVSSACSSMPGCR
jgi:hypothetical protein